MFDMTFEKVVGEIKKDKGNTFSLVFRIEAMKVPVLQVITVSPKAQKPSYIILNEKEFEEMEAMVARARIAFQQAKGIIEQAKTIDPDRSLKREIDDLTA